MQNLTVIENELVPVYETSTGEKVVYGTELYASLGSKRQYTDWIRGRLKECDALEKEDYQSFSQNNEKPTGGRPKNEYIIKLDTAKEMAMLERNEKGKQVRRYFIQVEKKFKQVVNPLQNLSPELQAIFAHDKQIQQVRDDVENVRQDLEDFKQDLPVLGIEEDKITSAVKKRGVVVLGGKESNSYKDKSLRGKVYSDIYRELKRQFGVSTYKAIKRNQCETAIHIIEAYEPPIVLAEQIADCNAQTNMEVA